LQRYLRESLTVPETLKVGELFEMMRQSRGHMACVIDEYGFFVGLVTLEDLLEEIVGEIADETDANEQEFPVAWTGEHWIAHGLAPIADVERETAFQLDEPVDANTVSGLIMSLLARLPKEGDAVEANGCRFTVLALKNRRAARVRIEAVQAAADEEAAAEAGGEEPDSDEKPE